MHAPRPLSPSLLPLLLAAALAVTPAWGCGGATSDDGGGGSDAGPTVDASGGEGDASLGGDAPGDDDASGGGGGDETCTPGENFDAGDGCNTCECPDSGVKREGNCTEEVCPVDDPCEGLGCGDPCVPTCPADDPDCVQVGATTVCDPDGECVPGNPTAFTCPEPDLCADVSCVAEPSCIDEVTLFGGGISECDPATGECGPIPGMPIDCSLDGGTCVDGACVGGDLCNDVVCATEDAYCDGDTAVYGGVSLCNPETGECELQAAEGPEDCAEIGLVCVDGACVDGDKTCTPGENFDAGDGCNTCTCPESGIKTEGDCTEEVCPPEACTEEECGPMPGMPNYPCDDGVTIGGPGACELQANGECGWTIVECPDDDNTCTPGENFEADDGCNTCMCPESGLKDEAPCTLMLCPPDDETCTPGESFEADDGCNTCICPESGLKADAGCTKLACPCGAEMPCGDGYFCDYANDDCGVWGGTGTCVATPETCIAGGPGACGCDGAVATNGCELQSGGQDVFSYGGCSLGAPETFACGEITCQSATELCTISMNDVVGPQEPLFYNSCGPLPEGCGQGDCGCITVDPWSSCYDGTGMTVVFYPGG